MYANEAAFLAHIRARAKTTGWMVYHHPDSRHAFASGFPDLVLVHPDRGRMAFIEVKSDTGRFTEEQDAWISALMSVVGRWSYLQILVDIWRPQQYELINEYLEGVGEWL